MITPSARRALLAKGAWLVSLSLILMMPAGASATKYAGSFMVAGGGARPLGMGSAFVAVADDASATFWNPAGLADQTERQIMLMHSERFGDIVDRDYLGFVLPIKGNTPQSLGLSIIRLGVDEIPFTAHLEEQLDTNGDGVVDDDELGGGIFQLRDQIRFVSDAEWAIMGSYARQMGSWLFGGNVKVITQNVGDYSSWGLGIDLGMLRRHWVKNLSFGVKISDATMTYLSWSTGNTETIAPVVTPGLAYDLELTEWRMGVLFTADLQTHFDNRNGPVPDGYGEEGDITGVDQFGWSGVGLDAWSSNLFLGMEVDFAQRVDIRVGSHGGFEAEDWTFGLGLHLNPLHVDYAFAGDTLGFEDSSHYTHRISVALDF